MENEYILTSDGELYHWKYIKREKKNGKWVYTYDTGETQKKNYDTAKKNQDIRTAQNKSAYNRNLANVKGVDGPKAHVRDYYSWRVEDKLKDATKRAKSEYSKTPIAKREQQSAAVKKGIDKVNNWVKDKLGYDEKEAMKKAQTDAKVKKYEAQDFHEEMKEFRKEHVTYDPYTGEPIYKKPGSKNIVDLVDGVEFNKWDAAKEAERKADRATRDFANTPLAKAEEAVDDVKDYLRLKLGYYTQANLEKSQDDVKYYKKKVDEIEKRIAKTDPKHKASIEYDREQLREYEKKLKEVEKELAAKQDDYANTPLSKISDNKRVYDWVNGILRRK